VAWLGKVFGAGIGFALGGPIGACVGAALGHGVDRYLPVPSEFARRPEPGTTGTRSGSAGPIRGGFFYATFAVMGHLAKSDGRVSPTEIALAESVMARLQLSPEQRRQAIAYFNEGKTPGFALDPVLDALRREARGRAVLLRLFLDIQFQMAYAEGSLGPAQLGVLMHIGTRLGLSKTLFQGLDAVAKARRGTESWSQGRRRGPSAGAHAGGRARSDARPSAGASLAAAYAVLGVPRTASEVEVKRAYRRLLSQHHPDKLVSRGLPPDMLKLADEKTHEIRTAYETIVRSRAA
jgi:DnaJ like chaperone protein